MSDLGRLGRLLRRLLVGNPPEQPTLHCWFDFAGGHTCMLLHEHDGPHVPTPNMEIDIELADPAEGHKT